MFGKSFYMTLLLLVASVIPSTTAWTATTTGKPLMNPRWGHSLAATTKSFSSGEDDHVDQVTTSSTFEVESRRSMIHRSIQLGTGLSVASWMTSITGTNNNMAAWANDDVVDAVKNPLADMDAIAAQIGRSSNYPNSISPLPTLKQTELELVREEERKSEKEAAAASDLSQALKESQRRKVIDPRTHG